MSQLTIHLTPREQQVMQMRSESYTIVEIARSLGISCGRVNNNIESVHRKLNVPTTPEAIAKLVEMRLITVCVSAYLVEI